MKRYILFGSVFLVLIILLATGCATRPKGTDIYGKTNNGDKITVNQLAKIAPGTGVLMMEIGNRWWNLYYAGIDGNWDLAGHEIKETEEAMEIIEVTRPKRKADLEEFLDEQKDPLSDAIKAKDVAKFKTAFINSVKACNNCHAEADMSFIKWQLPKDRPSGLTTKP